LRHTSDEGIIVFAHLAQKHFREFIGKRRKTWSCSKRFDSDFEVPALLEQGCRQPAMASDIKEPPRQDDFA